MPLVENLLRFHKINISTLILTALVSSFYRISKPIRPFTVTTNDADFILLTGVHGMGQFGQEIDIEKEGVTPDAVFLETGSFHYLKTNSFKFKFPKDRFEKMAFYHKLIPLLRQKQIPMLFGDMPFSTNMGIALSTFDSIVTIGAAVGGLKLALSKKSKNSLAPILGTGLSLWGTLGLAKITSVVNPDFIRNERFQSIRNAVFNTEISHPQDILGSFRNTLIAAKLLFYAQEFKRLNGRKPVIAIAMGSGHELISEYLKQGENFCRKLLNRYPNFVKKILFPPNLQKYYPTLVEVVYNNFHHQSHIFVSPNLKEDILKIR